MVTEVTSATAAQASTTSKKTGSSNSTLSSDFETFLKMLTAQARYQDPLEPIDSTEYAAQLAQFSMVEQQVQTNDSLSGLRQDIGLSNMAALGGWVGMEARAAIPGFFDGTPVTVSPQPAPLADRAELVVTNEDGVEIDRQEIPVSSDPVLWEGTAAGGTTHPWGMYSFAVDSYAKDALISSTQAEVYGRVAEAQLRDGAVMLVFEGGQDAPSTAVTGIRQPPG